MFSVVFITLHHKTCSVRCQGLEHYFTLQCCNDASDTDGMELLLDQAETQHTDCKVLENREDLTAGDKGSDSNPSSHVHIHTYAILLRMYIWNAVIAGLFVFGLHRNEPKWIHIKIQKCSARGFHYFLNFLPYVAVLGFPPFTLSWLGMRNKF